MLKCQICKETTTILAHQIRNNETVDVCLDCANRHYQDELTKNLIAQEMNAISNHFGNATKKLGA
jgi:hypothetical protein